MPHIASRALTTVDIQVTTALTSTRHAHQYVRSICDGGDSLQLSRCRPSSTSRMLRRYTTIWAASVRASPTRVAAVAETCLFWDCRNGSACIYELTCSGDAGMLAGPGPDLPSPNNCDCMRFGNLVEGDDAGTIELVVSPWAAFVRSFAFMQWSNEYCKAKASCGGDAIASSDPPSDRQLLAGIQCR
eukprot:scaffold1988_cov270-Prasinococcus_capsulatus_cf.AAC.7